MQGVAACTGEVLEKDLREGALAVIAHVGLPCAQVWYWDIYFLCCLHRGPGSSTFTRSPSSPKTGHREDPRCVPGWAAVPQCQPRGTKRFLVPLQHHGQETELVCLLNVAYGGNTFVMVFLSPSN